MAITDRVPAHEMLERQVRERTREIERRCRVAEALHEILAILNSNRPLADILDHVVAQAGAPPLVIFSIHAIS